MKIGVVVEPYEEEHTSGISYAIMSQAAGMLNMDAENEYIFYTHTPIGSNRFVGKFKNILVPKSFVGKNAWFIFASIFQKKEISDVLIFNMPLLPLVVPRSIRTIPIFYELSAYREPGVRMSPRAILAHVYRLLEKTAVKRSSRIITASVGVQKELIDFFNLDEKKVSVVYNGFQKFKGNAETRSKFADQRDHFLFAGRVKYKKNVHNIVEGFIKFRKENPLATQKLFIVGLYGGGYYENIAKKAEEAGLEKDVVFTGFVNGGDLYHLYKNARGLVFCSLQEGFGMPILEAMDFGVPVITSNRAPMNEVAGNAAILVDPENTSQIADAMKTIVFDARKREELIRRGKSRAGEFSWEKNAKELLTIVKSIM